MTPLLIGVSGKAEHGKNAFSNIICEYVRDNGGTAGVFEISGLILQECIDLGQLPPGTVRDQNDHAQNKILVDHGSKRRESDTQYWPKRIVPAMIDSGLDVAICPNIRFPDEGAYIKEAGGYIVRLNRLNADGTPFVSQTRDPNHPTETALDRWPADFYLTNLTGHGKLLERLTLELFDYIVELDSEA